MSFQGVVTKEGQIFFSLPIHSTLPFPGKHLIWTSLDSVLKSLKLKEFDVSIFIFHNWRLDQFSWLSYKNPESKASVENRVKVLFSKVYKIYMAYQYRLSFISDDYEKMLKKDKELLEMKARLDTFVRVHNKLKEQEKESLESYNSFMNNQFTIAWQQLTMQFLVDKISEQEYQEKFLELEAKTNKKLEARKKLYNKIIKESRDQYKELELDFNKKRRELYMKASKIEQRDFKELFTQLMDKMKKIQECVYERTSSETSF